MEQKNVVQLDSNAYELIKQDKANISLTIEIVKSTKAEIQSYLREKADKIFKLLKEKTKVEASSEGQNITDNYIQERDEWVARGYKGTFTIGLVSYDFEDLNNAIELLDDLAQVSQITTSISSQKKKEVEDKLTKNAIKAFQNRAENIAQAFGFNTYTVGSINISRAQSENQQGRYGISALSAASMSSASPEPEGSSTFYVQPRSERVTVTVNGNITMQAKGIVQ